MSRQDADGYIDPKIALYQKAIVMRAEGKGWDEIASVCGVHRRTLWEWRHDNVYRLLQDEFTERVKADGRFRIRMLVEQAVDAVADALKPDQTQVMITRNVLRLRAAELVFERVGMSKGKPLDAPTGDELPEQELDAVAERLGWKRVDADAETPKTPPAGSNGGTDPRH